MLAVGHPAPWINHAQRGSLRGTEVRRRRQFCRRSGLERSGSPPEADAPSAQNRPVAGQRPLCYCTSAITCARERFAELVFLDLRANDQHGRDCYKQKGYNLLPIHTYLTRNSIQRDRQRMWRRMPVPSYSLIEREATSIRSFLSASRQASTCTASPAHSTP